MVTSLCLFFHYLVWMTMAISMMFSLASWIIAIKAIKEGDSKLIQAAFSIFFLVCHLMAGVSFCYLLVF